MALSALVFTASAGAQTVLQVSALHRQLDESRVGVFEANHAPIPFASGQTAEERVIVSAPVSDLKAGEIVQVSIDGQWTVHHDEFTWGNPERWAANIRHRVVIGSSPADVSGTEIGAAMRDSVVPDQHHGYLHRTATYQVPSDLSGRKWINFVARLEADVGPNGNDGFTSGMPGWAVTWPFGNVDPTGITASVSRWADHKGSTSGRFSWLGRSTTPRKATLPHNGTGWAVRTAELQLQPGDVALLAAETSLEGSASRTSSIQVRDEIRIERPGTADGDLSGPRIGLQSLDVMPPVDEKGAASQRFIAVGKRVAWEVPVGYPTGTYRIHHVLQADDTADPSGSLSVGNGEVSAVALRSSAASGRAQRDAAAGSVATQVDDITFPSPEPLTSGGQTLTWSASGDRSSVVSIDLEGEAQHCRQKTSAEYGPSTALITPGAARLAIAASGVTVKPVFIAKDGKGTQQYPVAPSGSAPIELRLDNPYQNTISGQECTRAFKPISAKLLGAPSPAVAILDDGPEQRVYTSPSTSATNISMNPETPTVLNEMTVPNLEAGDRIFFAFHANVDNNNPGSSTPMVGAPLTVTGPDGSAKTALNGTAENITGSARFMAVRRQGFWEVPATWDTPRSATVKGLIYTKSNSPTQVKVAGGESFAQALVFRQAPSVDSDVDGDGLADLVTVDAGGAANVAAGKNGGVDASSPTASLSGQLDSALLDGKGRYIVDVADINDDRRADLTTIKDEGKVVVHLGQSNRTFGSALEPGISLPPAMNGAGASEPIAVADVTGDDYGDLIVFAGPGAGSIKVYKGQSNGKFETTAAQSLSGSIDSALLDRSGSYFVGAADVTGDNRADLVTMNSNKTAYVYKGQEDGKFGSAIAAASINANMDDGGVGQEPIGLGDVTGDDRADLVNLCCSKPMVYPGQGDGKFGSGIEPYSGVLDSSLTDGAGEEFVDVLDTNGDGREDLVSVTSTGAIRTFVAGTHPTLGTPSFAAPVEIGGGPKSVRHLSGGSEFATEKPFLRRAGCFLDGCEWPPKVKVDSDVDGDGRADLVSADFAARVVGGSATGFLGASNTSVFDLYSALFNGKDKSQYVVDVADVTGEGRSDLITMEGDGGSYVYPGLPSRGFGAGVESTSAATPLMKGPSGTVEPFAAADVNGDGRADPISFFETTDGLVVSPGNANGTLGSAITSLNGTLDTALFDGSGHYFVEAADVTGDGYADAVSINANGSAYVFKGASTGKFSAPVTAASINPIMDDGSGQEPVGLGDVTADGRADLLTLDGSTLKLWAGEAGGTFGAAKTAYSGSINSNLMDGNGEELIGLLDYSRDGRPDLAAVTAAGVVRTYTAQSDSTFASPTENGGAVPPTRVNRYGREFSAEKPLMRRAGCEPQGCEWPPEPDTDQDMNGDSKADLVTVNSENMDAEVFLGTSEGFATGSPQTSLEGEVSSGLLGLGHHTVDIADVTGDGIADLVTMVHGYGALVYHGANDGTFDAEGVAESFPEAEIVNQGGPIEPIAAADVNGDGRSDLVAFDADLEAVTVAPGKADGTFAEGAGVTSSLEGIDAALVDQGGHYFVDVTDVNADKYADLVTMETTTDAVHVFRGQSNGTFLDRGYALNSGGGTGLDPVMDDGKGVEPIGLGNFDLGPTADLLLLKADGTLTVRAGTTSGSFNFTTLSGTTYAGTIDSSLMDGTGEELIGLLDYNGDDLDDLVSVTAAGTLRTYEAQLNAGTGVFSFAAPVNQSGTLVSTRSNPYAFEFGFEKPALRRVGCTSGTCWWP